MNNRCALFLAMVTVLLTSCTQIISEEGATMKRSPLPPCTREDTPFENVEFKFWSRDFNRAIDKIVTADLRRQEEGGRVICNTNNEAFLPPTPALREIARELPPWSPDRNPGALRQLSESDVGAVLIELLRTYECSLREYRFFLPSEPLIGGEEDSSPLYIGDYLEEIVESDDIIAQGLVLARANVRRTIALLGPLGLLQPLQDELTCIQRLSLDLRNTLGLTAEVSSCLPRTWDTRGSLFTPGTQ